MQVVSSCLREEKAQRVRAAFSVQMLLSVTLHVVILGVCLLCKGYRGQCHACTITAAFFSTFYILIKASHQW